MRELLLILQSIFSIKKNVYLSGYCYKYFSFHLKSHAANFELEKKRKLM